jgi:hypothetical protein
VIGSRSFAASAVMIVGGRFDARYDLSSQLDYSNLTYSSSTAGVCNLEFSVTVG